MAEEEFGVAVRAPLADIEAGRRDAESAKLMDDGGGQIELPVSGAGGGEDASPGVGGEESVVDLRIHLVTLRADAGADSDQAVTDARAEALRHRLQRARGDAPRRAAPAGVRQADGAVDGIEEEDGEAVRDSGAEQRARRVCHQRVAAA